MNVKILLASLLLISPIAASAQSRETCETKVSDAIRSINVERTPETINQILAPDFTCAGQKGSTVILVLKQLLNGISDHSIIGATAENGELTLLYDITSSAIGRRKASFLFDSDNRLKRMDLEGIAAKTMQSSEVETSDKALIPVPVRLSEANMLIAEAHLNGETKRFIIDGGAPGLILNSRYATDSTQTLAATAQSVNGAVSGMNVARISEFDFYGMKIKDQDVMTMNLSHLEKSSGSEIHGLIGYQVFKDYDLLFDYPNRTLTFIRPDHTPDFLKDNHYDRFSEVPIALRGHIPYLQASIGNRTFTFGIDNGAGNNLLDASLWKTLKKHIKTLKTTSLQGAGDAQEVKRGLLKQIRIGDKRFKNTFAVFNDMSHLNAADSVTLDGLIGYEILSRQKTLLSFRNKKLLFID